MLCAEGSLARAGPGGGAVGFHALPPLEGGALVELTRSRDTTDRRRRARRGVLRGLGLPRGVGRATRRASCSGASSASSSTRRAFARRARASAAPADIDDGMVLGLNHPRGPFGWADAIGLDHVLAVLDALRDEHGEERYRAAPLLRRSCDRRHGHGRRGPRTRISRIPRRRASVHRDRLPVPALPRRPPRRRVALPASPPSAATPPTTASRRRSWPRMRAYPKLRPDSNLRAWVLTIAHRKALDHHRARARRAVPGGRACPDVPAPPDPEPVDDGVWERVRRPAAQAARGAVAALRGRPDAPRGRGGAGQLGGGGAPLGARGAQDDCERSSPHERPPRPTHRSTRPTLRPPPRASPPPRPPTSSYALVDSPARPARGRARPSAASRACPTPTTTAASTRCSTGSPTRISPRVLERRRGSTRSVASSTSTSSSAAGRFDLPIDWSLTSRFGRKVLAATAEIPFGEVSTYAQMARRGRQPEGEPRRRQRARRQPDADRRAMPSRAAHRRQGHRQLHRRRPSQGGAAAARGRAARVGRGSSLRGPTRPGRGNCVASIGPTCRRSSARAGHEQARRRRDAVADLRRSGRDRALDRPRDGLRPAAEARERPALVDALGRAGDRRVELAYGPSAGRRGLDRVGRRRRRSRCG